MSFTELERSLIESPEQQQESSIIGGAVQEKLREEAGGRSAIYGSDEQRMKKKKRMIEYQNKVRGTASDKENTTSPNGQRQPPKKEYGTWGQPSICVSRNNEGDDNKNKCRLQLCDSITSPRTPEANA